MNTMCRAISEIAGTRRDNLYAHKIREIEQHLNIRVLGG